MELKDVILSTLAEIQDTSQEAQTQLSDTDTEDETLHVAKSTHDLSINNSQNTESELNYLSTLRERILVLFEGFQAPNNTNIEAKIDLTLNFLEYVLATIDSRIDNLEKGNIK